VTGPRNLALACMLVVLSAAFCTANDVYFAQSATGGGTGTSCATAESVATFNNSGQVAGNTYHLCGTVTTALTPTSSGTSSSPITLLFDAASGGNISMPALPSTGGINLAGLSYWTIDGGTACGRGTSCAANLSGTGIIQGLCNASPGTVISGCSAITQSASAGINLGSGGSNIEIRNLLILNMYQRTSTSDDNENGGEWNSYGIVNSTPGSGSNILIHDLTVSYAHALIQLSPTIGANNWQLYNTLLQNAAWMTFFATFDPSEFGAGAATNLDIYNNEVIIGSAWGSWPQSSNFHVDGIFVVGDCPGGASSCAQSSASYFDGVYIYNNYIHGNWGTVSGNTLCGTGFIYENQNLENVYIFNNIFSITNGGYACNGLIATGYGNTSQYMFNNTFIGTSTASGGAWAMGDAGTNAANSTTAENNVVSTMVAGWLYQDDTGAAIALIDYNDWYNLSGNGQASAWQVASLAPTTFTAWKLCTGCVASGSPDVHGTSGNPLLTSDFHLTNSSSAAWQAGANLYSTCNGKPNPGIGALCFDAAGVARPATGSWDMGAYEDSASNAPAPPTGLSAVVQ